MISIKFDKASVMSLEGKEYMLLALPDYDSKVKARKFVAEQEQKLHVAEIKRYREKRSLDANTIREYLQYKYPGWDETKLKYQKEPESC